MGLRSMEQTEKTVYVVGHKNPDTDSICSALGYARLLREEGHSQVRAVRAGQVNRQSRFVLDHLGVTTPPLVTDVSPRVGDVVSSEVISVLPETPLSRALELYHEHNIRLLPVVAQDNKPLGMLFIKRVAEQFVLPREESRIRRVLASPASIARCLKADILHSEAPEDLAELNLYVGAMEFETFKDKVGDTPPEEMVLIAGDRRQVLEHAVDIGVRVLVVVGKLPVPEDLMAKARAHGVSILSTGFDTATASWLTRLATPVEALMSTDYLALPSSAPLEALRQQLLKSQHAGAMILDNEQRLQAVATKSNLLREPPVKLILMDHNELSQAVDGADKVEIQEIIDHHRLGNEHTDKPIRFLNQPVGSTCTLVAEQFRFFNRQPDKTTAGLLLAGLLSDTVLLKSPTTTEIDRQIAPWLGECAGLDPWDFGEKIFAAGSSLQGYASAEEIVLADFKEFAAGEQRFGIGQIEVVGFEEFYQWRQAVGEALEAVREKRGLSLVGLLVTDILKGDSLLQVRAEETLLQVMGFSHLQGDLYSLEGVMSRKKQVVPPLLRAFQDL